MQTTEQIIFAQIVKASGTLERRLTISQRHRLCCEEVEEELKRGRAEKQNNALDKIHCMGLSFAVLNCKSFNNKVLMIRRWFWVSYCVNHMLKFLDGE